MERQVVRDIILGDEGTEMIATGVRKATDLIKSTMGARGRFVLIQNMSGGVVATKDGANTAAAINLPDPIERMGARMVVEASNKTAESAGDGTTTTTVLLGELVRESIENIKSGTNPVVLGNELEAAKDILIPLIAEKAITVDNLKMMEDVATISANGDKKIGKLVAEAVNQVGAEGSISIMESTDETTYSDIANGLKVDAGYYNPSFINVPSRRMVEYERPLLALTDHDFSRIEHLQMMCEMAMKENRPIIIFGDNFDGEALQMMLKNFLDQRLKVCLVRLPGTGDNQNEIMEDIAALTGGNYVSAEKGSDPKTWYADWFGECDKINIYHDHLVIAGTECDAIEGRIQDMRQQVEIETNEVTKAKIEDRLSRLEGGVGVIYVGAKTDSALKEKQDRIEDAVLATQSALEEGIMPGGGKAYYELAKCLKGDDIGSVVLKKALTVPMKQIWSNAGISLTSDDNDFEKDGFGIDVITWDVVNMVDHGIIDPAKVVRCAIENAVEVANVVVKSNGIIYTPEHE